MITGANEVKYCNFEPSKNDNSDPSDLQTFSIKLEFCSNHLKRVHILSDPVNAVVVCLFLVFLSHRCVGCHRMRTKS